MATVYNPKIVTDGLVLCLDAADENSYPGSGTTWYDLSGNGNDATLNGLTYNSNGWFQATSGTGGDATTSSITMATNMTMECWYKSSVGDSFSTYGRLMDRGDTTISIGTYSSYRLRNWIYAGGSRSSELIKGGVGQDGIWHHTVLTYDGSNGRFYFDGELVSSNSKTGALESSSVLQIFDGDGYGFGGQISISRYNSIALSSTEVSQNFNAQRSRFGV